jgi:hypothetical protein
MAEIIDTYNSKKYIVIPCNENSKIASIKWKDIKQSITTYNSNSNYGIICGEISNLTVIDIDVKNKGLETFNNFLLENNLNLDYFTYQKTPSGGLHILFNYTNKLKTTTNINGVSIDIRNDNSYILCEPSIINNKKYEMINLNKEKIKEIPEVFLKFLQKSTQKETILENHEMRTYKNTDEKLFDELLEMIPESYIDDYTHWLNLLCICKNIYDKEKSLKMAHHISRKSSKYIFDEVNSKMRSIKREVGYGFTKLKEMCYDVDEHKTLEIIEKYIPKIILDTPNGEEIDKFYNFDFKDKYNINEFQNQTENKIFIVESLDILEEIIKEKIINIIVKLTNEEYIFKGIYDISIGKDKYIDFIISYKIAKDNKLSKINKIKFSSIINKINLFSFSSISNSNDNKELKENNLFNIETPLYIEKLKNDGTFDLDFLNDWIQFTKEIICNNNETYYNFIINFIRNIFLKQRNYTALLLYSEVEGCGKNFFINFIEKIIGKNKVESSSINEVVNPQTDLSRKLLIVINELTCTKEDKRHIFDKMKDLITGTNIKINQKYLQPRQIDLNSSIIATSNNNNCLIINEYDRRYSILNVSNIKAQNYKYFEELNLKYNNDNGYLQIYNYIVNFEIKVSTMKALETEIKDDMITQQDTIKSYINDIKENLWIAFENSEVRNKISGIGLYEDYKLYCKSNPYYFIHKNISFLKKIKENYNDVFEFKKTKTANIYIFKLHNTNNNKIYLDDDE